MEYAGSEQLQYHGISYRSILEWKRMLAELEHRCPSDVPSERIVEMIKGWLDFLEQREAVMPLQRRWECEGHLNLLFRRLSRSHRAETHDCTKVFVSTAA